MASPNFKKDRNFISSLSRGLTILEAFDISSPRMGITQISRKTGLSKSTVFRLLYTLRSLGYVIFSSEPNKYTLGPRVLRLGYAVLSSLELREVANPYLMKLSSKIHETVNLAVLDREQLIYVERIKTQQIVNINLHVGSRLDLYNTSMGRVLAAFQSKEWLSDYMKYMRKIPQARPYWEENGKKFREILRETREKDYAVNNEDLAPGLRSVASPVRNSEGKVVGAVNIAVSSSLYSIEKIKEKLVPALQETTRAISSSLGYNAFDKS